MTSKCSHFIVRDLTAAAATLLLAALFAGAQTRIQAPGQSARGVVELEAAEQRREGRKFYAEGDVEIRYQQLRLRADRIEYDSESGEAVAAGRVRFEHDGQVIEAEEARYNLQTSRGTFRNVRGSIHAPRNPNPNVLLSPNPFYFEAKEVERADERTYTVRDAWVTVCDPGRPVWRFHAPQVTIRAGGSARLVSATFRLFEVPILYLPYASAPVGRRVRQSGFLVPHFANSSRKGFVVGDAFYWAPAEWFDVSFGAELLSRRGWSQLGELRARPWENVRVSANYFGVNDRGLRGAGGVRQPQDGYQGQILLDADLGDGWRAVADINYLTSLRFRLAFAETFAEAVNSEVHSSAFVTNNFRGFSVNFATDNHKNFLNAEPERAVVLRTAPSARFSSVEQSLWTRVPLYFGFHVAADGVHRSQPGLKTADVVQRLEIAPRVTLPLRWGPWLGLTSTYVLRNTRYGSQLQAGSLVGDSVRRTTGELNLDVRPPALARVWGNGGVRWKHVVEPKLVYRYVEGVSLFDRFLRFDESDTITDTNEIEYSVTHRFFRRPDGDQTQEVASWRVGQKHYFDPTFGGALVPGQRNVFRALNSVTPYAFADTPRRFSPMVSDLRITPGGQYDAQFRFDYDTTRGRLTAMSTLVKMKPYRESFITLAHFATRATPTLQPASNQIRALVGYGDINRMGWNAAFGFSYDVKQKFLQNQVAQVSYNGACCGIGFEYRRLALGPLRSENQFRVALMIANIGTFGNLRRQEKIF